MRRKYIKPKKIERVKVLTHIHRCFCGEIISSEEKICASCKSEMDTFIEYEHEYDDFMDEDFYNDFYREIDLEDSLEMEEELCKLTSEQ
jgi:hypothetical protein